MTEKLTGRPWSWQAALAVPPLRVATVICLSAMPLAGGDSGALSIQPFALETRTHGEVEAERGKILVPENRRRPDSGTIELAFVRLPARSPRPGPPIIYLAGGPGGSGIQAGQGARFRLFDALRDSGAVILLDQRGTGESNAIEPDSCEEETLYPFDRPLQIEPYLALVKRTAETCAQLWREHGVDLDAYTTEDSAADLEALRVALGAEQVDLLGISYGTHLAMTYMRLYPGRVRRAVLAGAEGPDHTVKLPSQFDAQLDKLQATLDANLDAERIDIRTVVGRVLDGLERRPVTIRIVNVEGPDAETRLVVGRRDLAAVTMSMLSDPQTTFQLPALYRRLTGGDFTDVADAIQDLRRIGGFEAMPEAMDAASGISPARRDRLYSEDKTLLLGSGVLQANLATARGLGVRDLGDAFRSSLVSDIPTLFISGNLDGRTPPTNAEELIEGFSRARHIVVRHGGHGNDLLIATPELERSIVDHFLGREPRDTEIAVQPPKPAAARLRMPLSPPQAARFVGEYERRDREIWRILHHQTIETLDPSGQPRFSNAVLQIRWDGDGFPFHPVAATTFYIDFPWFIDMDFRFDLDESGRVTHLVFVDGEGQEVRMEKVH